MLPQKGQKRDLLFQKEQPFHRLWVPVRSYTSEVAHLQRFEVARAHSTHGFRQRDQILVFWYALLSQSHGLNRPHLVAVSYSIHLYTSYSGYLNPSIIQYPFNLIFIFNYHFFHGFPMGFPRHRQPWPLPGCLQHLFAVEARQLLSTLDPSWMTRPWPSHWPWWTMV